MYKIYFSNNILRNESSDKLLLKTEYDDKTIKIEKEIYEGYVFNSEIVIEKNSIDKIVYKKNVNNVNEIEYVDLPKPIFDKLDYYSDKLVKNKSNCENYIYICSFCYQSFNNKKILIFHINHSEHYISSNDCKKSCLDSIKFKPIKRFL